MSFQSMCRLQAIFSLSKHLPDSQPFIANPTQNPMARDEKSAG